MLQCAAGGLISALSRATTDPALPSNQQTGLRLLCNAFRHPSLAQWLQTHRQQLLDEFAPCCTSPNKGVRAAFATFLLNLATLFKGPLRDDAEGQAQVKEDESIGLLTFNPWTNLVLLDTQQTVTTQLPQ